MVDGVFRTICGGDEGELVTGQGGDTILGIL